MAESSSSSLPSSSSSVSVEGERGIRLRIRSQARFVDGSADGFRLTVQAWGASQMPVEIFRYIKRPYNVRTGTEAEEYDGVCSSVDLEELPVGGPLPGVLPPFFRADALDLVFRSRAEAQRAESALFTEVKALVDAMDLMDDLDEPRDLVAGDPPDAFFPG